MVYPSAELPPDEYVRVVAQAGRGINDLRLLRLIGQHGEAEFNDSVRRFGWTYVVRDRYQTTLRGGLIPGYQVTLSIARAAVAAGAVPLQHHTAVKLLVDDGHCSGCLCLDASGALVHLRAGAVVLCTGGFAGLFALNDNPSRMTGDGHVLALEAGCRLRDLEMIQFFPFGLDDKKLPRHYVGLPVPPGTQIRDENGADILARHFPAGTDMYKAGKDYRDAATIALLRERAQGHRALVDLRGADRTQWPQYSITSLLPVWGWDPAKDLVPVAPIAHFVMGGVVVDENLETDVKGLFAAGEVAGGVHGANRYAANALPGCLVHGRLAAEAAVAAARARRSHAAPVAGQVAYLLGGSPAQHNGRTDASLDEAGLRRVRARLGQLFSRYLNPLRSADTLNAGLQAVAELEATIDGLWPLGQMARSVVELRSGIKLAKWAMRAALEREESRGAHYRDDYPQQDDEHWRRSIFVKPAGSGSDLQGELELGPGVEAL